MAYYAEYTLLINDAVWGRHDYEYEADSDQEAIQEALKFESSYIEKRGDQIKELLLDHIYNEHGKEIL